MSDLTIQASFNSGEWSPKLYARVDLTKYRSGAALLENWFVDYRGGASTRPGTKYILQCFRSDHAVRLITFQASFSVGYVLEFGEGYVRFFFLGAPVLETATSITGAAAGPPEVFTDNAHGYLNNEWIYVSGNYYVIANRTANTFTLTDLFGVAINTNPFVLPAAAQRVYTVASPYTAAELALVKFAQNVNTMILCHPNHPPYQLILNTAANWTLTPIAFGATNSPPVITALTTTLAGGPVNYAYTVTSVDGSGQESAPAPVIQTGGLQNMSTTPGSNNLSWAAAANAQSYNVYKSIVSYFGALPAGIALGFIGNVTGQAFVDTNVGPDFSQTPPVPRNPFSGAGVQNVAITNGGNFTNLSVPAPTFTGGGGTGASAQAVCSITSAAPVGGLTGSLYAVNDTIGLGNGIVLRVTSVDGIKSGRITGVAIVTPGSQLAGVCASPAPMAITSGTGTGGSFTLSWTLIGISVLTPGAGYAVAPTVGGLAAGGAAAVATLGAGSLGNPTVPGFFQQRLVLAGQVNSPQNFNMSRPGIYYNYDVSVISEPDDAISGTLISGQLNAVKAMVPQSAGLLMFTDRNDWLINGGSQGSAVSPSSIVANAQSFNGISDVPPIIANFDILYVQAKGSIIRDAAYNIYANVYTGTDISIIASHLFYGYTIREWAWAEEPFKVVWAVRNDGVMLTLTFLKEQEFTGWAHSITQGSFKSVTDVIENTITAGEVDAIYTVVQRTINGQSLQYIERIVERTFPNGATDAWCVDCGIQYSGVPATHFTGAQFLAGTTVTGVADGLVITPFVMPVNGAFDLGVAASKVTIGLGYNCDLETLPLELGDPTIQGKVKKINDVDVRVADTLGLSIGSDFDHLVPMKDLVVGNVSSMLVGQSSQIVTGLVSGDARTILDPTYTVPGQYCIRQAQPLPATVLGVIPNITIGDTGGGRKG